MSDGKLVRITFEDVCDDFAITEPEELFTLLEMISAITDADSSHDRDIAIQDLEVWWLR